MSLRRSSSTASSGRGKRPKPKTVVFDPSDVPTPNLGMAPAKKGTEKTPKTPTKELIYRRGEYLALRTDDDGYYLCKSQQHVYAATGSFKIMWLSELAHQPDTYIADYIDSTELNCIITHVRLNKVAKDTYKLPDNQKEKIQRELKKALEPEESEEDEDSEEEEEEDKEEGEENSEESTTPEEEDSDDEPPAKKARQTAAKKTKKGKGKTAPSKSRPKPRVKATASTKAGTKGGKKKVVATKAKKAPKKTTAKAAKPKKEKKVKEPKPEKPKKRRLTPEERANPNLLLEANPKVTMWEKNPLTHTNEKVPFVSPTAHSKLVFRAVAMNDMKLLQSLIDNTKNIDKVDYQYALESRETPIHNAVKTQNTKALQLLMKELWNRDAKKPARCSSTRNLLKTAGTGRYNRRSLHIPAVRALSMSRGSKEGNNALTKDESFPDQSAGVKNYVDYAMSVGASKKILDTIMISSGNPNNHYLLDGAVSHAIRAGHRKLAASLLEEREKRGNSSFNQLAREVMGFDKEELRKASLREASIKKKSWDNLNITPLHCAAINPNTKYLSKLFSILPEYGITDKNNRRPIHYAAACEGTGPLEYLMNRGVDPDEPDGSGTTPLMIACETGRAHNVELLLRQAKAKSEMTAEKEDDDDEEGSEDEEAAARPSVSRYGIGGIDRPIQKPNRYQTYCPIHLAVEKNQAEAVKSLIKYGVDVHKKLSAGKNRLTPLMIAAAKGNIAIMKMLIKEKARVEEKDKLMRTPLIHAVMNGQAHAASYLLSLGASPNQADSSGNTCLHYAAAYGWYFCAKTLIQAGADPAKSNDWQVAPLGIAFLKGHMGIVDFLLQQPSIDINFQDDQGKTLLALACSSELMEGIADEVTYLVNKKGADVTITDVSKNTPLHHLAQNGSISNYSGNIIKECLAQSIQIAKVLISNGASGADRNEEGITPVMYAIEQGNTELVRLLIDKGGEFSMTTNENGQNSLHLMAQKCMASDLASLLDVLKRATQKRPGKGGPNILQQMAAVVDKAGYTPLLYACKAYRDWSGQPVSDSDNNCDEDEDNEDDDEDDESEPESDDDNDSDYDSNGGESRKKKKSPKRKRGAQGGKKSKRSKTDESDTAEKVDPTWNYGRQFITALFELCDAKRDVTVQEKKFAPTDDIPKKESERYEDSDEAKFTPLHYLVAASNEEPIKNRKGEVDNYSPVLDIFLKRIIGTDLDHHDLGGVTPLIACLKHVTDRSQDCAKKLIYHEADCNLRSKVKSDHGATPLCIAVSSGCKLDVIEKLLKADIHLTDTKHHNTALHLAVSKDRSSTDVQQLVEKLLKAGANVNAVNRKGRTPLHLAVNANSGDSDATSELESFLVDHRADVLAKDHRGRLPIHYAFTKIGKYTTTDRTDPIELCTTLASYMAHQPIDVPDKRGQTPLHLAARRGAGVCCTVLVQKRCNINAKDKAGNTPLTLSAIHGHESCAIMLIQKNAAINVTAVVLPSHQLKEQNKNEEAEEEDDDDDDDDDDESQGSGQEDKEEAGEDEEGEKEADSEDESDQTKPNPWVWKVHRKKRLEPKRYPVFQVCVKNNWPGVIYMMLEVMDEANLTVNNTIEAALNTGQYNLALTLMRKFKDDRKFRETNRGTGRTLFHTLAVKVKPNVQEDLLLKVANELLRRTVPLNSKDHYGCKPLHYAALMHNTALIKFIIEHIPDLDVNESDRYGRTPMAAAFWTLKEQSLLIYQSLYELNATLNDQYSFPDLIMHFGKVPSDERSASEVEAEYVTEQKSVRCTPLIRAIQMQNFDMVKRLLMDGADPNARDSLQRVPLVHAIRRNNVNLVKLLLNHSYNLPGEDVTEVENIEYTKSTEGQGRQRFGKKAGKRPQAVLASGRPQFSLLGASRVADSDEEEAEDDENEDEDEEEAKKSKGTPKKDSLDINLSKYKAFRNVSGVKLTVLDQQGWSLVHHVVAPVEEATYDNVEMLKLLSDAGAPLGEKDMTGLTPLDYALRQNAPNLAKGLQKLTGVNKGHWDKPTLRSVPSVSDGLVWTTPRPNFNADAAALIKKYEDTWMEDETDNKPEPDSELEMDESGEVEMDTEQNLAYDVVLTKVDVQGNSGWGQFNFYIMQVVKHKAKDLWILFNRWGYIGDNGQFQRTPFGKRDDALKEFCKIFKAKTGNDWKNVKSFEAQPKKYRVVDPEDRRKKKSLRDIKLNLKSTAICHLPDNLADLMKEIMDPHMLRSAYDEGEVDSDLIPFSRLRKETIMKTVALLNKLRPVTDELEEMRTKDLFMGDNMEKYKEKFKEVVDISNQIYQLIPDRSYAFQSITVLARPDEVQALTERLMNLAELELASRITAGAMYRRNEIHPADYLYRSIGTTLRTMNPDEIEAQYLLKYLSTGMSTSGHYRKCKKIEAIFEVNRPGEQQRTNRCHLENHKLLFHGTKASNLVSILHRGLLIAPPGALITGHLHGKGIYLSDMFDKSADYCHNWFHRGTKQKYNYMLICEVALGDPQVVEYAESDELAPYNSRLVPGKEAPRSSSDVKLRDGCILPLGDKIQRKAVNQWWLPEYSEYIVFSADQARMRYLVKFSV